VVSDADFSFVALRETKECVIAIPAVELAPKVVQSEIVQAAMLQKFARFGLTPLPAECVAPPLVAECFANLECKVVDTRLVNKYDLFVLEVLKAWTQAPHKKRQDHPSPRARTFVVDGKRSS